jgi:hypothetical protein
VDVFSAVENSVSDTRCMAPDFASMRGSSQHQNEFPVLTSSECSAVHAVNWFSLYL